MLCDPAGPGAAPLALLCMDKAMVEDFNTKHKNVYKYEVLGRLHTLLAKSQLAQQVPDMYKQWRMQKLLKGCSCYCIAREASTKILGPRPLLPKTTPIFERF